MEISKLIFLGKLFIYVGYGIKKKKIRKIVWKCYLFKEKEKGSFLFLIHWLKSDVCLLKAQITKNFFPRTLSEKYIPGKQCIKLQEYAIRLA